MYLLKRSQAWLALVMTAIVFSVINMYFLSPNNYTSIEPALHTHRHVLEKRGGRQDDKDEIKETGVHRQTSLLSSKTICPALNVRFPQDEAQPFQPVNGSDTFVYSAFGEGSRVRIIVLWNRSSQRAFSCQLWSNNTGQVTLHITKGFLHPIPEDHNRQFLASYILCSVPPQLRNHPHFAVSVVHGDQCSTPSNLLTVQYQKPKRFEFTVCVAPLNTYYSDIHSFVEMIEFNRLLGADRFVFYNYSIHPNVGKILYHYSELGLVDILPWTSSIPPSAHYFGQLASLNDCLYRYKHQSRYIVYQDLDEFIVPTGKQSNWSELVASRLKSNPRFAVFQVQCTFFRKEWPKPFKDFPPNKDALTYRSVVLGHTLREGKILPHGTRSKYIINPGLVETVGIHDVWASSGSVDKIPKEVALLYHYRDWEFPNDTQARVEDTFVVRRYGMPLINRLARAWKLIKNKAHLQW